MLRNLSNYYRSVATCSSIAVTSTAILIWWSIITDDRAFNVAPIATSPTWDKFISGYAQFLYYKYIFKMSFLFTFKVSS